MEDPEVAVAVIVEHDTTASQAARQILNAYFSLKELGQLDTPAEKQVTHEAA